MTHCELHKIRFSFVTSHMVYMLCWCDIWFSLKCVIWICKLLPARENGFQLMLLSGQVVIERWIFVESGISRTIGSASPSLLKNQILFKSNLKRTPF